MPECVLDGERAQGLAETHQPWPVPLRQAPQPPFEAVQQRPVLLAAHRDPVQEQKRRAQRVLKGNRGAITTREVLAEPEATRSRPAARQVSLLRHVR